MRPTLVAAIAPWFVAGCDTVFGLEQVRIDVHDATLVIHDEDGDGIDNVDDDCPTVFDPSQLDGDQDHVGDVCDPHPTAVGDHLALADYFDDATYAWTPDVSTSWSLGDGAIETTDNADVTFATLSQTKQIVAPTVAIGFVVVDYGTDKSTQNGLEIAISFPTNSGVCRIIGMATGDPLNETVTNVDTVDLRTTNLNHAIPANTATMVMVTRESSSMREGKCLVNNTVTPIGAGMPTAFSEARASIFVHNMKVSLKYILLYDVE